MTPATFTPSPQAPPATLSALRQRLGEFIIQGGTLGQVMEVEADEYEALYAVAHAALQAARYQEAADTFGMLVSLNPYQTRFLQAYATSLQMLGRYEDAIVYFSLASMLDLDDPRPFFHIAQCMLARRMPEQALEALDQALPRCEHHPALQARAQAMRDLIVGGQAHHAPPEAAT